MLISHSFSPTVPTGEHQRPQLSHRMPKGDESHEGRSEDEKLVFWALCEQLWEAETQVSDMKQVVCRENNPKQKHPDGDAPFKLLCVPEKRNTRLSLPGGEGLSPTQLGSTLAPATRYPGQGVPAQGDPIIEFPTK